ncbi:DEAD-box RNA helicase [Hordeum vulgare]|nr:DEAD-box RNA helicase [Hordeum vulgare]
MEVIEAKEGLLEETKGKTKEENPASDEGQSLLNKEEAEEDDFLQPYLHLLPPSLVELLSPSGGLAPALRLRAAFRCWALGRRWAGVAAAIASPNFVLSEHAFKRLRLDAGSDDEVEDGYGSDLQGPAVVEGDKDELAISRLGLPAQLIATLEKHGITHLFPIQVLRLFTVGRRVVSDSVEFSWSCNPLCIHRRGRIPRALVLAPTRELAKQVENEIMESAPKLSIVCVYGGVSYNTQQNALPSCCYHLNTVQGDDCMEHFMG